MEFIKLIRVKHWVKNLFLFIPLFFAGEVLNTSYYIPLILGFFAFGLVASSIYILNDLQDIENDKIHPKKKFRPLAAGTISKKVGITAIPILLIIGFSIAYFVSFKFSFVLAVYFILNIAYTFGFKKIAILDIIIVSIGFVIRIKAGSIITLVPLSQWIIIMVFLLALFLAIAKRRDDLIIKESLGTDVRAASKKYSLEYLNTALSLISGVIIVAYLMYTLSPEVIERMGTYRLFYTSLFVIAGILRYLQLALVENNTGSPTSLLYKDRFIQGVIILWVLSFYLLIYFKEFSLFV
ncbi:MAG: decaprenyl-phosphate phosphoribosyltransferase [Parvicella sp.]